MRLLDEAEVTKLAGVPFSPSSERWYLARDFLDAVDKDGAIPDQSNPHYAGLDQCWKWGGRTINGYAAIGVNGGNKGAHRVSYELHHGEIPEGMVVMHKCDNKICTNPNHLEIGTHRQNSIDAHKRGLVKAGKQRNADAPKTIELPLLAVSSIVHEMEKRMSKMISKDQMEVMMEVAQFHAHLRNVFRDCLIIARPSLKRFRPKEARSRLEQTPLESSAESENPILDEWMNEIYQEFENEQY